MKPILQSQSSECGLACLAMIATYYGYETDLPELRRRFIVSQKGATLAQLMKNGALLHLAGRPLRLELEDIAHLDMPCILHWNLNHFVVLVKVVTSLRGTPSLVIYDPTVGERRLSLDQASSSFTGVALEFTPTEQFVEKIPPKKASIRDLTGTIKGLRGALFQIIALAAVLEIFSIVTPLFNQFIIDDVIVSGDHDVLKLLLFGFALITATQSAITMARSWFLMRWNNEVGFQWGSRVFFHLIRLPAAYFEKRHLGDIVSRFGSLGTIQSTLTSLFVETMLDGLMALAAMGMMITYSGKMSIVVILSATLYLILRAIFYQQLRDISQERLILSARENSNFLESMRAAVPIKLFNREVERHARWQNLRRDVLNRDIKTQKLGLWFKLANNVIFGAQSLALMYIGAESVMGNLMSIGMMTAFASYASTFSMRVFGLVDTYINVRMLSMHTERLADIVLEPTEPDSFVEMDLTHVKGNITLKDISFRYAEGEPWILNGINLSIEAGQSIAFVGGSGCGKTTLCKLILGLLTPTEGEISIDGIPIAHVGLKAYRQLIGTVMQDDQLLSGSLLDNISFFDVSADAARVEDCARRAAIHDDINAMPMRYQTLVGDMGSSLSGGQKQRILLARALYKEPIILALDEATSHLDVQNEKIVNESLRALHITRIMIAHRPETIRYADRIINLSNGTISKDRLAVDAVAI